MRPGTQMSYFCQYFFLHRMQLCDVHDNLFPDQENT